MKLIALFILLILSNIAYSQKLKDKLQGDWVCTKILDSNGNKTSGKFGASDEYLKFSFKKGNLSITEAPFDKGVNIPILYKNDFIDLFPGFDIELPERIYALKSIDTNNLILTTKDVNSNMIDYYFVNQATFKDEPNNRGDFFVNGLMIIKNIRLNKNDKIGNRVAEYKITNLKENLYPCPIFEDSKFATFGHYFTNNFIFPNSFPLDSISEEMVVDFDVNKDGACNIKIIKGLGDELNSSVTKVLNDSAKKWKPLMVDKEPVNATLRFHFVFYDTFEGLKIKKIISR